MLERRTFISMAASAFVFPPSAREVAGSAGQAAEPIPEVPGEGPFSPKLFGCAGDGITDDTVNFRRAVDAAIALRRPLDVSGANYLLKVQPGQSRPATIIPLNAPHFTMIGDRGANIRIAPDCGNYRAIFAPTRYTVVDTWRFINVGFDKNSQNNVIPNTEIRNLTPGRYSVYLIANSHIRGEAVFDGCLFENSDAVVDIYLPEPLSSRGTRVTDPRRAATRDTNQLVRIVGCEWRNARLGGTRTAAGWPDHDQSLVNFGAQTGEVVDCVFEGQSWDQAPTTAIETRCSNLIVRNNRIRRFQVGMNITVGYRHSAASDRSILVTSNSIETSRRIISIWPVASPQTNSGRVAGSGVTIRGNLCRHRWTEYVQAMPALTGIWLYLTSGQLDLDELTIAENEITYDNPGAAGAMERPRQAQTDAAIGWLAQGSRSGWKVRRLTISGNRIAHSPCSAIGTKEGVIGDLAIVGNRLTGCACAGAAVAPAYRSIVRLIDTRLHPNADQIVIRDNHADTAGDTRPHSFIRLDPPNPPPAGARIYMAANVLADPGATVHYLLDNANLNLRTFIESGVCQSHATPVSNRVMSGSRIDFIDKTVAKYRYKESPTRWTLVTAG